MFRPWHPSKQRATTSSRPTQRNGPSRLPVHSEDAQPNESINKRQRHPPSVNSVAVQQLPWRARPWTRRDRQSTAWESSENMRPNTRNPLSTPANAAQSTSNQTRIQRNLPSAPLVPAPEPPAPKRRKLEGASFAEIKRGCPTEKIVSTLTSSVSPVSSETLVGEHRIKRERSISPDLSAVPQLITSGSKRYAPLPPECRTSQAKYKTARNAWARKEQEALKRLGLKVVRTFIREDGMVIDWETTNFEPAETDAVIERALLLNHAALTYPSAQPIKPTTPYLAHVSPDLNQKENGMVEITSQAFEGRGGCESVKESYSSEHMSNPSSGPYQGGVGKQQVHPTHASTPWQTMANPPASIANSSAAEYVHDAPSDPTWLHKTTNNVPSSSGYACKQPSSPSAFHHPSQHGSISPQQLEASPSPSQRAIDTLQHILYIKRQRDRGSSDSMKPPVVSPSPSSPMRKLFPVQKTPQPDGPSRRSPGSSADAVAAAINEGTQVDRQRSAAAPPQSAPLRAYKRRPTHYATPAQRKEGATASQTDREHQTRRSQSSGRYSSPPIAVLVPMESSPASRKASSSAYCDEYDELELSFPPSPTPSPPKALPDSHLPTLAIVPTESPLPVELVGPALQHCISDIEPPSPDENAMMQSSALRYLEWYCRTFDMDRRALAEAYAPDAFFSCSSRGLRAQGRDAIIGALEALGPGVLCSRNSVEYDVTYLGPDIGVLLVVLSTMNNTREIDGDVRYAMSFVLRSRKDDPERPAGGLIPLVAAVHQMVLRDDTPRASASGALMPSPTCDG